MLNTYYVSHRSILLDNGYLTIIHLKMRAFSINRGKFKNLCFHTILLDSLLRSSYSEHEVGGIEGVFVIYLVKISAVLLISF